MTPAHRDFASSRQRDLRIARHPGAGALADKIEARIRKEDRAWLRRVRGEGKLCAARAIDKHDGASWAVYFVLAPQLRRIKIGVSTSVDKRYKTLRECAPEDFQFLGWIPGGVAVERALHHRLRESRAHGEWFDLTPETLQELARFSIKVGDPLFS